MKRIILGVTGGSCASDAVLLAERLTENGYEVDAILAGKADATLARDLERVTGRAVYGADLDENAALALANGADLAVVAPASAAAIARLSAGLADDLLTATLLALSDVPVLLCPAARDRLYRNQIAQRNRRELENLGYYFFDAPPESDRLLERVGDMLDPECWGAYI